MPDISPAQGSPLVRLRDEPAETRKPSTVDEPDQRDGRVYRHDDETRLAIEVALTTGRPLLLRGEPGSGKSSLAAYVARNLNWRYFEHAVTAATRAEDLLWRYDAVRRLSDAQVRQPGDPELDAAAYVEPGVLWWALDPNSAKRRGAATGVPEASEPGAARNQGRDPERAVVLIDELDKADPDVPNGLLVPLGSTRFRVSETGAEIRRDPGTGGGPGAMSRLLVVITTNEERELPPAFLRRCIVHTLQSPGPSDLVEIARLHFGNLGAELERVCLRIAKRTAAIREEAKERSRRPPSTAEFLDAVRACRAMGITLDSPQWKTVERVALRKDDQRE